MKVTMQSVSVDAEESTNGRRKHHGRGPELVRAAATKRLKEFAREDLSDEPGILGPREVYVAHKSGVSSERPVRAILCERRPSCEQGPYRTLVIADRVEYRCGIVDRANTPAR